MFAIFRKRAGKLSADLEALQDYAAGNIQRAEAHISGARQVINILSQEIDDWSQNAMGSDERFSAGYRERGSSPNRPASARVEFPELLEFFSAPLHF